MYYVSTTGNDSNPGTQAQPWRTIQHAANVAASGDTIYVRAGDYFENVVISRSGTSGQAITLVNFPDESVTLNGGSEIAVSASGALGYWVIQGLTIRSTNRYTVRLGWWGDPQTTHLTLRNNKIFGSTITLGNNNLFENNDIDGSGYAGTYGDAGLMDIDSSYANVFRDNTIHDFTIADARGIWTQGLTHDDLIEGNRITNIVASGGSGQCIDLDGAGNVEWQHRVIGNSVDNCSYVGIQLENAFAALVQNNVISNAKSAGIIVINYAADIGCKVGGDHNQYGDTNGDGSCKGDPTNNVLRQNIVSTSTTWGSGYGGIVNWGAGNVSVIGNTFYPPSRSGNGAFNIPEGVGVAVSVGLAVGLGVIVVTRRKRIRKH